MMVSPSAALNSAAPRPMIILLPGAHLAWHGMSASTPGECMSSDDPGLTGPAPGEGESVPAEPHPYSYVTIRLTADEFVGVAQAARAAGQTVPEFARAVVVSTAARDSGGRTQGQPPPGP